MASNAIHLIGRLWPWRRWTSSRAAFSAFTCADRDDRFTIEATGAILALPDGIVLDGGDGDDKLVLLRADEQTPHGTVVRIMDLARAAGAKGLTIAARRDTD